MIRITVEASGPASTTLRYRKAHLGLSRQGRGHYDRFVLSVERARQVVRDIEMFTRDDWNNGGITRVGAGNFIGTPNDLLAILDSADACRNWGITA